MQIDVFDPKQSRHGPLQQDRVTTSLHAQPVLRTAMFLVALVYYKPFCNVSTAEFETHVEQQISASTPK